MHDFAERLRDYLEELADLRQRGAAEASLRDAFLRWLRDAFPGLGHAEPILLEKHIPALRVRGGFADALFGDLIFECKKRLDDASRADGQGELTRYLSNQDHPERYLGILTDGETLEVYALRDDQLAKVDELRLAAERAGAAHLWLDCYLFHERQLTPTADDVALRFGERSPTFRRSRRILQTLWGRAGAAPAAQTKFAEWQGLLAIVYGSAVGDEALFLRHTYLALFARILAFVALERRAPDAQELPGIVTGETFERMGFENFVENDFFTWVEDPAAAAETRELLRAIATRLTAAYDLAAIREDLLKELYQELVDPQTRHDLGEFYTPDWLAELTLRQAGFPPAKAKDAAASLLDPSCGSGTFLFTAVRLLREAGRKGRALVEYCTDHLAGIDVHPLAVTIAKTNLLLALGDAVRGYRKRIALPVYMADTLSSVQPALQEDVVPVSVDVDTIAARAGKRKTRNLPAVFELPAELADRPELLQGALNALLQYANPGINDSEAREGFLQRVQELGVHNGGGHVWRSNLTLMRWLLAQPATDSVWRFVLRNAYQPALLARRQFAFVVGNPPWLSYRYIKRTDYQERVRELVFRYELLGKRQAHLFTQMELATLFFAFCADRYLAEGGTIAFVMPRSVLTGAKQHAAFRARYVAAARSLIDCEQVAPLFNVPACVVISRKADLDQPAAPARGKVIPMLHLQGQLPSRNAALAEAQQHWQASQAIYTPLTAEGGSPYLKEIIQGATIVPRCLWFVRPPEIAWVVDQCRPQLETDAAVERQAKAPWRGVRLNGSVEANFLFATLLCDQMLPFGWRKLYLTVLPLEHPKREEGYLLDPSGAARSGFPYLADWLRKAEKVWSKHRKRSDRVRSPNERLDFGQCLIRQHPAGVLKVLHCDAGTHVCSCVVDARDVSGWRVFDLPVRGFIAEHVTYWFETGEPDEAHYLSAALNAPLVDQAIKPYQTRGAFGAQRGKGERHVGRRPFEVLPIPRYRGADKRHRRLARLSRDCHDKVAQLLAGADERWLTAPIGRLRTEVRQEHLRTQLDEIDALVAEILEGASGRA
ncbi:MAG TPA: N-6 DNA methylase [Gemmataceae bacterium]|nr:N-6 DNA methylase [Gemmataceae bacterium]